MIVTIQRELGAGGLSIGEVLAEDLGASLLSERAIISNLCDRGGFTADYLEKIDEKPPTPTSSFMTDLARASALVQAMEWRSTEHTVVDEIRDLVLEHAQQGHVVVVGHGGPKLLHGAVPRNDIYSILLHAPREWRIERVQERFEMNREDAADRVRRTDELRRKYLQHFFASDLYDARSYDLVLDTARVGIDVAIEIARTALRAVMHSVTS